MLKLSLILAFWALVLAWGIYAGLFSFALRMLSRILVSDRRRPAPVVTRAGGLGHLPGSLAGLATAHRRLQAAIADLRQRRPAYHRSFEGRDGGIREDRRHQAARRDFEDAVIHVARALDDWCAHVDALDPSDRARLRALTPLPAVPAVRAEFPWLPRQVHQVGALHFRDDEPALERRLLRLEGELQQFEQALTHGRARSYR